MNLAVLLHKSTEPGPESSAIYQRLHYALIGVPPQRGIDMGRVSLNEKALKQHFEGAARIPGEPSFKKTSGYSLDLFMAQVLGGSFRINKGKKNFFRCSQFPFVSTQYTNAWI